MYRKRETNQPAVKINTMNEFGQLLLQLWEKAGKPEVKESTKRSGVTVGECKFYIPGTKVLLQLGFSSEYAFKHSQRIGPQFSGLGSSDGMRDAYSEEIRVVKNTNDYPNLMSLRNFSKGRAAYYGREAKEALLDFLEGAS